MRDVFFAKVKAILGRDAVQNAYKFLGFLPDKPYLKLMYRLRMGRKLDLKNPRTFNEKLQWIKLNDRNPLYTLMVDKLRVKDYVSEKIGSDYVVPLLGVWDRAEDIDFASLPRRFVLKCTHDSYGLVICRDKAGLDIEAVKRKIGKSLRNNYYKSYREWPYKDVPRRIIAEEYIEDNCPPEGVKEGDLPDYKVLCFNGKPSLIEVHKGRFTAGHSQDWYDADWNWLEIEQSGLHKSESPMARPDFLDEMIDKSAVLAEGIPEVRVDWYHAGGRLLFGELTFFDGSGFCRFLPDEWDYRIGSMIELPKGT